MSRSEGEPKQDLARERTDYAEDRTILANERTFASWFRTGLGAVGIGLGFQALFSKIEPAWVPRLIATVFLLLGIFLFVAAERQACKVLSRLSVHSVKPFRNKNMRLITVVSSVAVTGLIAALWMLPFTTGGG